MRLTLIFFRRRLLWIDEKADNSGRMGLGLVACDGRPEAFPGSDDAESNVRKRRNSTGRPIDSYRCRPV